MSGRSLILLPPSEGKATGGNGPPLDFDGLSFESLNPIRVRMTKALAQLSQRPRVARKLLGVKGVALEKALHSNDTVEYSPTLPAIERYTGVMYDAIDYRSFDSPARETFDSSTIIMSGLFGMVRPSDMIPDYKLKMGATLLRRKTCSLIWKPVITKTLAKEVSDKVIWDLLPGEHGAAWAPSKLSYKARFTAKFLERRADGQLKTITHLSKLLKGALVRHLVCNPAADSRESALELLTGFSHPEGYEFRPELTSELDGATELVFLKAD